MKSLLFSALLAIGFAGVAYAEQVNGTWKTEEGDEGGYLLLKFGPCGAEYCGVITKVVDGNGAAEADSDLLGKRMVWGMQDNGDGSYSGGRIWAPDADRTYRSRMAVEGGNLRVSGCVGPFCRSQTWTRAGS